MRKKRILIVDGDNVNATKIQIHLQHLGFLVTVTDNCDHGKAILKMSNIDLLILDPTLPDSNSDFLNELASERVRHKPAVVMSSVGMDSMQPAWDNFIRELPSETRALVQAYVPKGPHLESLDAVVDLIFESASSPQNKKTKLLGDYRHPLRKPQ